MYIAKFDKTIFKSLWLRLFCVLFLLVGNRSAAQDFQWVYSPEHLGNDPIWDFSNFGSLVSDKDGNIYAVGVFRGITDFDDSEQVEKATPVPQIANFFLIKLDKDKKFQWVKYFSEPGARVTDAVIRLDHDENLIVSVSMGSSGFEGITIQPDNYTINGTITNQTFGLLLKIDLDGGILQSRLFDIGAVEAAIDSDNNIIVTGYRGYYDEFLNPLSELQVHKVDASDLHTIWQTNIEGSNVSPNTLETDSQGNIYMSGRYIGYMIFDGITHNSTGYTSSFICKFDSNGQEKWIKKTDDTLRLLKSYDDALYATIQYVSPTVKFGDQTLTMPFTHDEEIALLKLDSDASIIWSKAIHGNNMQRLLALEINSYGELITVLNTENVAYLDGKALSDDSDITALLKLDSSGNFINIKEIIKISNVGFALDPDDNILVARAFTLVKDFDPDPVDKVLLDSKGLEGDGFILKLAPCDNDAPTGEANLSFCEVQHPTVADLKIDQVNVQWFATATATVPLSNSVLLQDGQKYYAGLTSIPNCPPVTSRFEVAVTLTPVPPIPIVSAVQPCFSNALTLKDINIQGQNLIFYETATSAVRLPSDTVVQPGVVYYVSQRINFCDGLRTAFSISGQSAITVNDYSISLCDADNNGSETIDLSDYNSFIVSNYSSQNHQVSFYKSDLDAFNNTNPITNFQDYDARTETIYVRITSVSYGCFETAELAVGLSPQPEIAKLEIQDWSDNNSITVLPLNSGYSYSIDGIAYQSGNTFHNLIPGEYEVFVKDNGGICNSVSKKVFVLGYPKFFTPNGDGINDYWKIRFAVFQFAVDVEIYDRYGKLITGFDKMSVGWDGKLKGENLPATDYWFRIVRVTDREIVYRGHFSLVR